MSRVPIACVLVAITSGCASVVVPYRACRPEPDQFHRSRSVVSVPLRERSGDPGYYLISGHYLIALGWEDTLAAARTAVARADSGPNVRFLQALEGRPIGRDSIDLMTFTFDDWRLWDRPTYLAAALLEKGAASVVDLQDPGDSGEVPRVLRSTSVVTLTGGGKWREFCGQTGDAILSTVDEIYN
jgi:hypothetical protein